MTYSEDVIRMFREKINLITFGKASSIGLTKTRIRPVYSEDKSFFQEEKIIDNKAYHRNIEIDDLTDVFMKLMEDEFKNAVIYTENSDFYIRKTKKGKLSIMKRSATKATLNPHAHDLVKNYIVPENKPVPFLIELGIMNEQGQVRRKHYSKFRQINRFLELLDADYEVFNGRTNINVYDLCCGKGYLTLAIQYYFSVIKGRSVQIVGIDLKKDVIQFLNDIVKKLELENINFSYGDIRDAEVGKPNLVVALHACDIATDIALAKAVSSEAGLIMSVPCCQHELFKQIENEDLSPILKYGIMKDKFTELSTNALRGLALESAGYNVNMIEFTSLEHTAKNIMIKAVISDKSSKLDKEEFYKFSEMLGVKSSAEGILKSIK